MVKYQKIEFDRILYAISDSTRRRIIDDLIKGDLTVGELSSPFKMTAPGISKHLRILAETGLIKVRRSGRYKVVSLEPENLMRIEAWLNKYHRFWSAKLQELQESIKNNAGRLGNDVTRENK